MRRYANFLGHSERQESNDRDLIAPYLEAVFDEVSETGFSRRESKRLRAPREDPPVVRGVVLEIACAAAEDEAAFLLPPLWAVLSVELLRGKLGEKARGGHEVGAEVRGRQSLAAIAARGGIVCCASSQTIRAR